MVYLLNLWLHLTIVTDALLSQKKIKNAIRFVKMTRFSYYFLKNIVFFEILLAIITNHFLISNINISRSDKKYNVPLYNSVD